MQAAAAHARPPESAWLTTLDFRWDGITQGVRSRRFEKDQTLFLEGNPADEVFVIRDGRVRLTHFALDGKERHLMILGANGLIGDCGWPSARTYVVTAVAAADAIVLPVPMARLQDAMHANPLLMRQQQELAGMRFRIMLQHLALLGSNSSQRRVCHHLLGLMNSYGAAHRLGTVISIPFTQQEMGNICGLSRVSVSHVFTALERDGLIARAGRLIVIRDAARMAPLSTV